MQLALAFLGTALAMLALDIIFLTSMIPIYQENIGELLADEVRMAPAIAFYIMYVTGIVLLAIRPALEAGRGWTSAALTGAILGFMCYGTYDFTNQATLKVWPVSITIMDLVWGTFLTSTAAASGALAASFAPKSKSS